MTASKSDVNYTPGNRFMTAPLCDANYLPLIKFWLQLYLMQNKGKTIHLYLMIISVHRSDLCEQVYVM